MIGFTIKKSTMTNTYSLGSSDDEQQRLQLQREIYGDTLEFKFSPTDTIYEFGCGVGANLWLAQAVPNGQYVGIDFQLEQIKAATDLAKKLSFRNASFLNEDGTNTSLPDNSADASFCRCVLIHQPDPMPMLKEMCRVTKSNGRLIIIEPHDPIYYVGPNKPNLLKSFKARTEFAYGSGRGTPNAAVNLHSYFCKLPVTNVTLTPHIISVKGTETERCTKFLRNFIGLIEPSLSDLVSRNDITEKEWQLAKQEASEVVEETFIMQMMWIAEAAIN